MKLPDDVVIPREKLTGYLLVHRDKNDKSKFLAQAGFTQENPDMLETAIRRLVRENEAIQDRVDEYGAFYRVSGVLHRFGDESTRDLEVVTIWIYATKEDHYRFVTLKPNKE